MKRIFAALCALGLFLCLAGPAGAENVKIRFGILPVLDTLPLQVAVRDGLFANEGLDVELVPFASALERDTAMQAGQIDGYFGDLVATLLLLRSGVDMHIALVSWRTTPGFPMFGIVSSPAKAGETLAGLKGASIGLSTSTVIEYLLDRIEAQQKLAPGYFNRTEVKKIPIRLQMLLSDQIDAALLPEPLTSLAVMKGGRLLAGDADLNEPETVLCLAARYFDGEAEAYKSFVRAYDAAVDALRTEPERYRPLMAETCRIPAPLVGKFPIYPYPKAALPTEGEMETVQNWMLAHGMLTEPIPYGNAVSPVEP